MARSTTSVRSSLTGAELATLRAALNDCRQQRAEQLIEATDVDPDGDPVAAAHTASVRRIVIDIDAALARMDAGAYGLCSHCDKPIPFARLEVLPYTTGCVNCLSRRDEAW